MQCMDSTFQHCHYVYVRITTCSTHTHTHRRTYDIILHKNDLTYRYSKSANMYGIHMDLFVEVIMTSMARSLVVLDILKELKYNYVLHAISVAMKTILDEIALL